MAKVRKVLYKNTGLEMHKIAFNDFLDQYRYSKDELERVEELIKNFEHVINYNM